jgi:hypothetical protein
MSATTRAGKVAVLFVLGLCLAGPASAQEDPLARARQRRELEAQRVEKEVREGRLFAYRVVLSDLDRALRRIKDLQEVLSADSSLDPARRDQLVRTLQRDVTTLQSLAADRRPRGGVATPPTTVDARRPDAPRQPDDRRSAYDEARRRVDSMAGRVADAGATRRAAADRFAGAQRQVEESAQPPASDYELPADWAEMS